jgi:hypothetical protein
MLEAIGVIIGLLGVWLFLCDKRNEFAMALMVVGLICLGIGTALAHDHDRPELDGWYASLMQPDNPTIPCCGKADAYWCDNYYARDGKAYCKITDDRPDEPLGRPHIQVGTEVEIPPHKLKFDRSNPTGHAVVFVTRSLYVMCFVQGGGV